MNNEKQWIEKMVQLEEERGSIIPDGAVGGYAAKERMDGMEIIAVAIRTPDEKVHALPPPCRHNDLIKMLIGQGYPTPIMNGWQGFLTNTGLFVQRKTALRIARKAGQLIREPTGGVLTSEDLW